MKFDIFYNRNPYTGAPCYINEEQSFSNNLNSDSDFSLMLGAAYVGLDIDCKSNSVTQLTGFLPKKLWKTSSIKPPAAEQGLLVVNSTEKLLSGTGTYYSKGWKAVFNPQKGWVCIGDSSFDVSDRCVEFSTCTLAVITAMGDLKAIWIKPLFV